MYEKTKIHTWSEQVQHSKILSNASDPNYSYGGVGGSCVDRCIYNPKCSEVKQLLEYLAGRWPVNLIRFGYLRFYGFFWKALSVVQAKDQMKNKEQLEQLACQKESFQGKSVVSLNRDKSIDRWRNVLIYLGASHFGRTIADAITKVFDSELCRAIVREKEWLLIVHDLWYIIHREYSTSCTSAINFN